MEILKPINHPLADLSWVKQAIREALGKQWRAKIKHLAYRLLWELRPIFSFPGSSPLAVDVELASYCNFRCRMCQQSTNWWNKLGISVKDSLMPWELFTKVVDECAEMGVYSMKINWRGEPMANPHFAECIRYMKEAGIHEVMMNTNASYITEENVDDLLTSGIDRIIISCDGVSRETYNKIRLGGDWDKFIMNVELLNEHLNLLKLTDVHFRFPIIRINVAVMEANQHEVEDFKRIFLP